MINYLGGLKKSLDHIRTDDIESEDYEPALVIRHDNKPGRAFIIMLSAFWKYLPPKENQSAEFADIKEFEAMANRALNALKLSIPGSPTKAQAKDDMVDITLAVSLNKTTGILPCVCFNLSKCLRMFEIPVRPESASQLHLWIQDSIEDLKNMPPAPPEKELIGGQVEVWEGSKKIASKDLTVKESDLIIEGGKA